MLDGASVLNDFEYKKAQSAAEKMRYVLRRNLNINIYNCSVTYCLEFK